MTKRRHQQAKRLVRCVSFVLIVVAAASFTAASGARHHPSGSLGPAAPDDLYMKDTPADTGLEPNPDTGPMWVTEDIWVRTTPDPGYVPTPFPEASPSWTPLANENPEYRDPKYSVPNYVYVRVRN